MAADGDVVGASPPCTANLKAQEALVHSARELLEREGLGALEEALQSVVTSAAANPQSSASATSETAAAPTPALTTADLSKSNSPPVTDTAMRRSTWRGEGSPELLDLARTVLMRDGSAAVEDIARQAAATAASATAEPPSAGSSSGSTCAGGRRDAAEVSEPPAITNPACRAVLSNGSWQVIWDASTVMQQRGEVIATEAADSAAAALRVSRDGGSSADAMSTGGSAEASPQRVESLLCSARAIMQTGVSQQELEVLAQEATEAVRVPAHVAGDDDAEQRDASSHQARIAVLRRGIELAKRRVDRVEREMHSKKADLQRVATAYAETQERLLIARGVCEELHNKLVAALETGCNGKVAPTEGGLDLDRQLHL